MNTKSRDSTGSVQSVMRNSAIMGATAIATKVMTTLFTLIVVRKLSADDFGLYGFALGFVGLFGVFFDVGLRPLLTREIVRGEKDPSVLYGSFLYLKGAFVAVNFGLILAIALAAGYGAREWNTVLLVALAAAAGSFFNFNSAVYNAYERMEHDSIVKLTWRSITFLGGWGALAFGLGLQGLLWVWLAGGIAATVLSFVLVRRHLPRWTSRPDPTVCRTGLRDGWPIWATSLFIGIYTNLSIVALKHFGGDPAVAYFNMPFQLIYSTSFLATAIIGGVTPTMFREARRDPERLARICAISTKWVLIVALPLTLGGCLFAESLVLLVRRDYAAAVPCFRVQSLLVLPLFLTAPFHTLLIAVNEQRKVLVAVVLMAAANLAANLVLIPMAGSMGASWSIVFTYLVGLVALFVYARRDFRPAMLCSALIRPVAAAAILLAMWLAVVAAGGPGLIPGGRGSYVAAVTTSGGLVYVLALVFTGAIDERERGWFASALGRRSSS